MNTRKFLTLVCTCPKTRLGCLMGEDFAGDSMTLYALQIGVRSFLPRDSMDAPNAH